MLLNMFGSFRLGYSLQCAKVYHSRNDAQWGFWPEIARNPVLHEAEPGFFSNAYFAQAVTVSYSARKSRWTAGSTLTPGPMVEDTEMDLTYLPLAEEGLTRRISVYRAA